MQVTVAVNGSERSAEIEPRMLLVHFLRDELRLTGTHWGATRPIAAHALS